MLLSNTTFKWIFCKQTNINLHWLGKSSHHFLYSSYYQTKSGSCHNTLQLQTFCLYTCTKGLQTYLDIYLHPLGSMTTFITNLLYIRKELFETVVAYTFTLMQIFKVEHLTARNKHATYTWSTSPIVIEPPNFSYCHGGTTANFSLWHRGINPILITHFYLSFMNVPRTITLVRADQLVGLVKTKPNHSSN